MTFLYIFLRCLYKTVDPEKHTHYYTVHTKTKFDLIIFLFIRKTNIIQNMTKTLHFDNLHLPSLWGKSYKIKIYGTFVELRKFRLLTHAIQDPLLCSSILFIYPTFCPGQRYPWRSLWACSGGPGWCCSSPSSSHPSSSLHQSPRYTKYLHT